MIIKPPYLVVGERVHFDRTMKIYAPESPFLSRAQTTLQGRSDRSINSQRTMQ